MIHLQATRQQGNKATGNKATIPRIFGSLKNLLYLCGTFLKYSDYEARKDYAVARV